MKKADVREKMETFLRYLREEQELRDQATSLSMIGQDKDVREAIRQESEILKKLERLRQEKMLPLLDELGSFVSKSMANAVTKGGGAKPAAAKPAAAPAKAPAKPAGKR